MIVVSTLRITLQKRCNEADFTPYFAFIEALPILKKGGHLHHILPKKEFPEHTKNPDNLIRLSADNHFRAHYYLALCASQIQTFQRTFFVMANMDVHKIQEEDLPEYARIYEQGRSAQIESARKSGKLTGPINGKQNIETGHMERMRNLPQSIIAKREAGIVAGKNHATNKTGIYGRSPEKMSEDGRKNGQARAVWTNHSRWHLDRGIVSPDCPLCQIEISKSKAA